MNLCKLLPLVAACALASCAQIASSLNEPIDSEYNPLDGPSASMNRGFRQTGPTYRPGQWVETVMPNATFFNKMPRGSATADKVLSLGSPLKVISTKDSYLKVELEGGSVGYVPAIMVAEPSATNDTSPFLPPPPSSPLQRSSGSDIAPPSLDAEAAPLQSSGGSLIPPPKNFESSSSSAIPDAPGLSRSPTEVVIPTTAQPTLTPSSAPSSSRGGLVPPPSGLSGDFIDQSIEIE